MAVALERDVDDGVAAGELAPPARSRPSASARASFQASVSWLQLADRARRPTSRSTGSSASRPCRPSCPSPGRSAGRVQPGEREVAHRQAGGERGAAAPRARGCAARRPAGCRPPPRARCPPRARGVVRRSSSPPPRMPVEEPHQPTSRSSAARASALSAARARSSPASARTQASSSSCSVLDGHVAHLLARERLHAVAVGRAARSGGRPSVHGDRLDDLLAREQPLRAPLDVGLRRQRVLELVGERLDVGRRCPRRRRAGPPRRGRTKSSSSADGPSLPALPAPQSIQVAPVALGRPALAPLVRTGSTSLRCSASSLARLRGCGRLLVEVRRLGRTHPPRHGAAHDHLEPHGAGAQLHPVAGASPPGSASPAAR